MTLGIKFGSKIFNYGDVLISEGVVLCTGFNGVELGPEDVSLLERCRLLGPNRSVMIMEVSSFQRVSCWGSRPGGKGGGMS